jgi:hypothetical protein
MMPEKTTSGPENGMAELGPKKKIQMRTPENPAAAPNTALSIAYLHICELKVLAAIAGTITRKPTRRVPTIWIPMATTTETRKR